MLKPLMDHWYTGEDPPFTGVAVKVTGVPWQTGFAEAETETLTGWLWFTAMVTMFEIAGLPTLHEAFEFSSHLTRSPFAGV